MPLPAHIRVPAGAALLAFAFAAPAAPAAAQEPPCPVDHQTLAAAVSEATAPKNGGLDNEEWAAVVNRNGVVCAVAFSGEEPYDQWLGSHAIAAEKATTANALSLSGFALSTANLYAGAQPGGPLYSLVSTNPPDEDVIYAGEVSDWGSADDPMLGRISGGTVVFGGGLPLYQGDELVGALGVSGDTSCADHNVAWRMRDALGLGTVPAGVSPSNGDQIIFDLRPNGTSASGYGHPMCGGDEAQIAVEIGAGFIPEWKKATD